MRFVVFFKITMISINGAHVVILSKPLLYKSFWKLALSNVAKLCCIVLLLMEDFS